MLLIKSKEIPKWLNYVIINTLILCLFIFISGFKNIYSSQIKSAKNNESILSETDTVYIDDDFNPFTPGWGVYCFDIIQQGISAVDTGGLVYVYNGVYYENVVINKSIVIKGELNDSTIIDGGGSGKIIYVLADSVSISDFNIKNSGNSISDAGIAIKSSYCIVENNIISNSYEGVFITESGFNKILSCQISNSFHSGVYIFNSSHNVLINDTIINNEYDGVYIREYASYNSLDCCYISSNQRYGIVIRDNCINNNFDNNYINENVNDGISISDPNFPNCSNNWILNNTISGNENRGLSFSGNSNNNIILQNVFVDNVDIGINIEQSSNNSIIYHNEFINNGINAFDECSNLWHNGYPSGGNYWSDYLGIDIFSGPDQNQLGSDGIGDTLYVISGNGNSDLYPLMEAWNSNLPEPDTIWIDDDYTINTPGWGYNHFLSIQAGINLITQNGKIFVSDGVYNEQLLIHKPVFLVGANNDSTIIKGNESGYLIFISADSVSIEGFTIQDGGNSFPEAGIRCQSNFNTILNNNFINNCIGIFLYKADNNQITQNSFKDNRHCGVYLRISDNNVISNDSLFSNDYDGIYFRGDCYNNLISENYIQNNDRYGIVFRENCINNTISNNSILNSGSDGISLSDPNYDNCNSNIIDSNLISLNNGCGIIISGNSDNNTITNNQLYFNFSTGLKIIDYSNNNFIHHCDFIGNCQNVYSDQQNTWDNGYPSGGNYWSEFTGIDNFTGPEQNIPGPDGIVDTSFTIPGSTYIDQYPFMNPIDLNSPDLPMDVVVDDDFSINTNGFGIDHFNNIQWGINVVEAGGTVNVQNGIYEESIKILKVISLEGENRDSTIIEGNFAGNVVEFIADSVNFSGFKIRHCGDNQDNSGLLLQSNNCSIYGNIINSNASNGITLIDAKNNSIKENIVLNNNNFGLFLNDSSYSNLLFHNDIMGNGFNVVDNGNNLWNDVYPSGGNFWDDYTGEDHYSGINQNLPGSDSIGDQPYLIPGDDNIDQYPFMYPLGPLSAPPSQIFVNDEYNMNTPGFGIDHFSVIQDGIDAVAVGGVVNVLNGIYFENVVINKYLQLVGENWDSTIIDGTGQGDAILVSIDSIEITGFKTIHGPSSNGWGIKLLSNFNRIHSNKIINNNSGICIMDCGNNKIFENVISNNHYFGIRFTGISTEFNSISENIITNNGTGISNGCNNNSIINNDITNNNHGIVMSACVNNNILNNSIVNNGSNGLNFDDSNYNNIIGNTIASHSTAINFHVCNYNTITNNTIIGNSSKGIYLPDCIGGGCKFNDIYHNNWINNGTHAYDECNNNWDNGYPSGGNYWENYEGEDNFSGPNQNVPGSDSIGDNPYLIPGGNESDFYPLMNPVGIPPLANIVYVDDDFDETTEGWGFDHFDVIQYGISFVSSGGTVNVANGIYLENLIISKQIFLLGETNDSTIIDGGASGNVISILCDSVSITSFTITNGYAGNWDGSGISTVSNFVSVIDNIITENYVGIRFNTSCNNLIMNNNLKDNSSSGILFYDNCDYNTFLYNHIDGNGGNGIAIYDKSNNNIINYNEVSNNSSDGILLTEDCDYNTVNFNLISGNNGHGISLGLYSAYLFSSYSNIENNIIQDNILSGICCDKSNFNIISKNEVSGNSEYGVKLYGSSGGNQLYHNSFINNSISNAFDINTSNWDNNYSIPFNPSTDGGNFWSDYSGSDKFYGPNQDIEGIDGIGDTIYNILGGNNIDQYPFMEPNGWNIFVDVKVFLEGVYNPYEIKPTLNSDGFLPLAHPYNNDPWNYHGHEGVTNTPTPDIVDWILVELRDTTLAELATSETTVYRKSAFLLSDGSVVDLDGYSNLLINYTVQHNLFVVIEHRNHLSIMSADPLIEVYGVYGYDFTISDSQAYLSNQKELNPGVWGMIAGDADASGLIDETDKIDLWLNEAGIRGYFRSDMNLDSQVNNLDKNDFWLPNLGLGTQVPE